MSMNNIIILKKISCNMSHFPYKNVKTRLLPYEMK